MASENQSSNFCYPVETSQNWPANSCNPMDSVVFTDDGSIIEEKDTCVDISKPEHEDGAADTKKKKKKKKESSKIVEEKPVSVKKIPKHVLLIQERQSKLREAEERRKREEEERLRKEEQERIKQEEEERLAQEKKRLKKEKEKEKLRRKKEEGKPLTDKQKEKARRLEAMRNRLLANANLNFSAAKATPYQKKKSKQQDHSNGAAISDPKEMEQDDVVLEELDSVEPLSSHEVAIDAVDDEDWDAKSWDVVDLKLQDFGDEVVVSEPEPLPKKAMPRKPENVVRKPENVVLEGDDKIEKVDKNVKHGISKPDDLPLRSPICCVMGHVDTGKTKLLDCIRGTNVQQGEAGGITQQIGATYFPAENIRDRTKGLKADAKLNVPGLLVIDTPGHESFSNLRSRGSGLCDIAVLVVDIMHGLEPQTIESLNLLKEKKTDFIVALNKVDRLYGWKTCRNAPIREAIRQQSKDVKNEFNIRITQVITQFKEQGLNSELYYKNREMGETYNIVPTSATSGEGIPDLLLLLVQWAQKTMVKRLTYSEQVQCSVLEVKVVEGHGTTIDVVLVNGVLHEGDQIVVCGMQGPIVTTIRALLTPHPMRELRVKGTYLHHKDIKAAQGIKIAAQGLDHTIAGTSLYVVGPDDDIEGIKEAAMEDVNSVISRIDKSGLGVYVQASTLGSLEALLEFLKTPAVNIPVSAISLGPVHKKHVTKASVMLEKKKEYGTILAFDAKVTPEAREHADELGVKIFTADIIYHLFDQFKAFIDNLKEERKREAAEEAVFPCKLQTNHVYNTKDPIILEVEVIDGIAKVGTPVCANTLRKVIDIGRIASIEDNNRPLNCAKKGQHVAVKIIGSNPEERQKMFGRHFEKEHQLVSKISRRSVDALMENFMDDDDLSSDENMKLLSDLKELFKF